MKWAWHITLTGVVLFWSGNVLAATDSVSQSTVQIEDVTPLSPKPAVFGEYWFGTAIQNFSEGKDEGLGAGVRASLKGRWEAGEYARFVAMGELKLYGARVQARYDDDIMKSEFRLREGYFSVGKTEGFETRVGALSQYDLNAPLLISRRRAFPGIREGYTVGDKKLGFGIWAQQAVPTSYSMDARRSEREKMPSFLTESVSFMITPAEPVEVQVVATHFRFNNLPAVVAFDSSSLGNTVNGEVAPNSEFKYGFEGFSLGADICMCMPKVSFHAGAQWLQNTEAPTKANRGQLLYLSSDWKLPQEISLRPKFSTYFNESDTSPAMYNTWEMGNNNRKGFIAGLEMDFKRYGFNVEVEYIQASLINPDPFQNDKQVFTLKVETNHVPF